MQRQAGEPTNVSIILHDAVRIRAAQPTLVKALEVHGYRPQVTRHGTEVPYDPSGEEGDLSNDSLIVLLRVLASEGVVFARDFKQGWAPADVVAELIRAGVRFDAPRATAFDGSNWLLWEHPWSAE